MTLTCTVIDGRPLNVITKMIWKKGDTIFTPSSRYKLSDSDKELTINPLDHSQDDAYFSCAAENAAGRGSYSATFQLLVHCKYSVLLFLHCVSLSNNSNVDHVGIVWYTQ